MFVVMTLGGITCLCIILIQRRTNSDKKNNNKRTERRVNEFPFSENVEVNKTNVSREYESIEDYMNTPTTNGRNNEIFLFQNKAYASVQHS